MIDLLVLQRLATRLGAVDIAERTRALTQRLAAGRFYVACIGQFKRGKSTLLNALVGDPILPTGVVPVTSVVTVLRYGERAARVKAGGSWTPCDPSHLADFVSEDQNPGNRLAVEAVEVFVPCQLLAGGMCLVDTPGVGSVFEESVKSLLQVSATETLSGVEPGRDWPALTATLESLGRLSAAALVRTAEARGARLLANDLHREVDERRQALDRPLAESQGRMIALRRAIARAEELLSDLNARLSSEQSRISRLLTLEQERFLAEAVPAASAELAEALRSERRVPGEYRQRAIALAVEVAQGRLERWRQETHPQVEERYRAAARRFIEMASTVQTDMARLPGLERMSALGDDSALPVRSRFHFTEMLAVAPESAGKRLLDVLGSFKGRVASVDRDAAVYLRQLLRVNSARSRNDFEERVLESRRRLERELRARLDAVTATAERALQAAEASSTAGGAAVAAQLDDLRLIESDLVSFEGQVDATQSMDGQE